MALRLDSTVYTLVQGSRAGLTLALVVVLLAAISEALGQSVVLFLNRVRPFRYALSLVMAVASNLIGYFLWSTAIWLALWLAFGVEEPFVGALAVVGLAYAPQLFAFFEVTPYFGNFFGLVLTLWTMAAVVVAVRFGMGMSTWQAALTGIVSWAAIQLFRRSLGRPVYALGTWVERRAAGSRLEVSVDDVMQGKLYREQYSHNWNMWKTAQAGTQSATALHTPPAELPTEQPAALAAEAAIPASEGPQRDG